MSSARDRIEAALNELKRDKDSMGNGTKGDFDWQSQQFVSNLGYVVNKHSGMRLCRGVKPSKQNDQLGEVFYSGEAEAQDNE